MLTVLRAIFYSITIPAIVIAIIIALGTSNKSTHIPQLQLTNTDIQHAENILHANQKATGKFVNLDLTERDLNIACTYLLNLYTDSQSLIKIKTDYISFRLLLTLPENFFGYYVPIQFELHLPPYHAAEIKNLHIGKITIIDLLLAC